MARIEDILVRWHAKKDITDSDYVMGLRVREVFEKSEMAGLAVIRLDRPSPGHCFDNAGHQRVVTECRQSLRRMRWYLGEIDDSLVIDVIGKGIPLAEMESRWSWLGGKEHVGRRVRLALRILTAKHWGDGYEVIETVPLAFART